MIFVESWYTKLDINKLIVDHSQEVSVKIIKFLKKLIKEQ